jgi:hypothetical protein
MFFSKTTKVNIKKGHQRKMFINDNIFNGKVGF